MGKSLNTLSKMDYIVDDNFACISNFATKRNKNVIIRTYSEKNLMKKRINRYKLNLEWITL
jgi:hypothetical protein